MAGNVSSQSQVAPGFPLKWVSTATAPRGGGEPSQLSGRGRRLGVGAGEPAAKFTGDGMAPRARLAPADALFSGLPGATGLPKKASAAVNASALAPASAAGPEEEALVTLPTPPSADEGRKPVSLAPPHSSSSSTATVTGATLAAEATVVKLDQRLFAVTGELMVEVVFREKRFAGLLFPADFTQSHSLAPVWRENVERERSRATTATLATRRSITGQLHLPKKPEASDESTSEQSHSSSRRGARRPASVEESGSLSPAADSADLRSTGQAADVAATATAPIKRAQTAAAVLSATGTAAAATADATTASTIATTRTIPASATKASGAPSRLAATSGTAQQARGTAQQATKQPSASTAATTGAPQASHSSPPVVRAGAMQVSSTPEVVTPHSVHVEEPLSRSKASEPHKASTSARNASSSSGVHGSLKPDKYRGRKRVYFEVEAILEKRPALDSGTEYLVKWLSYSMEECTWEPASNIPKHMREDFEKSLREQKKRRHF